MLDCLSSFRVEWIYSFGILLWVARRNMRLHLIVFCCLCVFIRKGIHHFLQEIASMNKAFFTQVVCCVPSEVIAKAKNALLTPVVLAFMGIMYHSCERCRVHWVARSQVARDATHPVHEVPLLVETLPDSTPHSRSSLQGSRERLPKGTCHLNRSEPAQLVFFVPLGLGLATWPGVL